MRREIKFRAWDKKNKKMLYPGNEWYDICCGGVEGVLAIPHSTVYDGVENKSKEWIPMQYTGLKDKNGREIYEEDIVKFKLLTRDGENRGIGIVEWNDIERAWVVKVIKSDSGMPIWKYYLLGFIKDEQLRVIGNIYENPELLEEAEK